MSGDEAKGRLRPAEPGEPSGTSLEGAPQKGVAGEAHRAEAAEPDQAAHDPASWPTTRSVIGIGLDGATDLLIEALRQRKEPLDITIEEDSGWICAESYGFSDRPDYIGVSLVHPEGCIELGLHLPRRRELLEVDWVQWVRADLAEKKQTLLDAISLSALESRWDGYAAPWLNLCEEEADAVDPSEDTEEAILEWLDGRVEADEIECCLEAWTAGCSQYLPGFALQRLLETSDSVSAEDRAAIHLRERSSGSPGGSDSGVAVEGDVARLRAVLEKSGLPFRLVEDARGMTGSGNDLPHRVFACQELGAEYGRAYREGNLPAEFHPNPRDKILWLLPILSIERAEALEEIHTLVQASCVGFAMGATGAAFWPEDARAAAFWPPESIRAFSRAVERDALHLAGTGETETGVRWPEEVQARVREFAGRKNRSR